MNIIDIIDKKRLNKLLTYEEMKFAFIGYLNKLIPDYQMSSLLMAICINGLSDEETLNLMDIFLNSGEVFDLSEISCESADKHSTGGIGDKVSLVLVPLLASIGITVPKMSGRGLGITGGTIDKLESIPGFRVDLSKDEIYDNLRKNKCVIVSQNKSLVPLDKVIYNLRDVSGTVASIPLIAVSILSKKIACGANNILIDLKYGSGAFMKNINEANELSRLMKLIGDKYNKNIIIEKSEMNTPSGRYIGNALEVYEAILILKGEKNPLTNHILSISSRIAGSVLEIDENIAYKMLEDNLQKGVAYSKFKDMVLSQGGDLNKFKISANSYEIKSDVEGKIKNINALIIGEFCLQLGAGKEKIDDVIDLNAGIKLEKLVGDDVKIGDTLAIIYYNKAIDFNLIRKAFEF